MTSNERNVRCPKCTQMFKSRSCMEQHQRDTHIPQRNTIQKSASQVVQSAQVRAGSTIPRRQSAHQALPEHFNRIFLGQNSPPFKCPCGKANIMTQEHLLQHLEDKNKTRKKHRCKICCESFDLQQAADDHTQKKHRAQSVTASERIVAGNNNQISPVLSKHLQWIFDSQISPPFKCPCDKVCPTRENLKQHLEDKDRTCKSYRCQICCDSFGSQDALDAHRREKHGKTSSINSTISQGSQPIRGLSLVDGKTYYCLTCTKSYKGIKALLAHENDSKHDNSDIRGDRQKSLHRYLDNYFKLRTSIDPNDVSNSFRFVCDKLHHILSKVRSMEGGEIFSSELRKAGSNATGLKVNKADEFDFNISVQVSVRQVIRNGGVQYIFADKKERRSDKGPNPKKMRLDRPQITSSIPYQIPEDYAVVIVDTGSSRPLSDLCNNGHLIAHYLLQRLHSCIAKALIGEAGINLLDEAHGPAITMMMIPPYGHHISVDLTPVIDWRDISVKDYKQLEASRIPQKHLISQIVNAGCQLTPKGDEFWNISFSNCESILMKGMDLPGECRKTCHKLLKSFFQTWRSRSKTGYKTISSFIFKHLTFQMNEKHSKPGYWKYSNLSVCFLDTLKELLACLTSEKLYNYFIPAENILGTKDSVERKEFAAEVGRTIKELENFN